MMKRIVCLFLALLLLGALTLSASADAIILPEYEPPYDITTAHRTNGDCKALNTFLSNFAEAGLMEYDHTSPDSVAIAVTLKHLELNAKLYSSDVKKVTGDDGKTYMRVSKSVFERRMDRMFDRDISASECPGYEDGSIFVSAEHFNGPIEVFASVTDCEYAATDLYRVWFDVYFVDKSFSNWYGTANRNLPSSKITLLGSGEALVDYDGGETKSSISTADFSLEMFTMDATGIPCMGENLPYGVEPTEPPTEAPTQAPTEPPTQTPTEEFVQETLIATAPANAEEDTQRPIQFPQDSDTQDGLSYSTLLLIVGTVLVVAVLALAVILLVFKKK